MEDRLCETPVTGQYIAKHMKASLGPHALLKSISSANKIAIRQGFLSNILRLELDWENDRDPDLPKSVVVKVPTFESMNDLLNMSANSDTDQMKVIMAKAVVEVHRAECAFYKMLANETAFLMPKYYVALPVSDDGPGMIILEDLSDKGMVANSVAPGLTYGQVVSAVTELARMHAWSLITPIDWRSAIPQLADREALMRGFLTPMAKGLKQVKEKYSEEFGDMDVEKIAKYVTYEYFHEVLTSHREFMDDVLVHGDLHMNNMLFEKMADGTSGDKLIALLDFQGVVRGSPAFDLARLWGLSVPEEIRRAHEQEVVRYYYDTVKSIAGDKFAATFEQFLRMYDTCVVQGTMCMVATTPMMINAVAHSKEGEERDAERKIVLKRIHAVYEDSLTILESWG